MGALGHGAAGHILFVCLLCYFAVYFLHGGMECHGIEEHILTGKHLSYYLFQDLLGQIFVINACAANHKAVKLNEPWPITCAPLETTQG